MDLHELIYERKYLFFYFLTTYLNHLKPKTSVRSKNVKLNLKIFTAKKIVKWYYHTFNKRFVDSV